MESEAKRPKCEFCGRTIRKGTRPRYLTGTSDGRPWPMHAKCYLFTTGQIDSTVWDIKTPKAP